MSRETTIKFGFDAPDITFVVLVLVLFKSSKADSEIEISPYFSSLSNFVDKVLLAKCFWSILEITIDLIKLIF